MWFDNKSKQVSKVQKPIPYTKESVGKIMSKTIDGKNKREAQAVAEQEVEKRISAVKAADVVKKILPELSTCEKYYDKLPRGLDVKTGFPDFMAPDEWQITISFEELQKFLIKKEMQTLWDFTLNAKFGEPTDMANFDGEFLFFVEERTEFPIGNFKRFVLHIPCNQFMKEAD